MKTSERGILAVEVLVTPECMDKIKEWFGGNDNAEALRNAIDYAGRAYKKAHHPKPHFLFQRVKAWWRG